MTKRNLIESLGGKQVLSAILDTTEAMVLATDETGSIIFVNQALEKATGFTSKEYIGRPIWAFRALNGVAEGKKFFQDATEEGEQFQKTTHWRCKDGGELILSWTVKRLNDEDGNEIGRLGTAINLTGRARDAARAMAAEQQRRMMVHLVENLSEPLFFIDPEGAIAYTNSATERIYGYAPDELIGQSSSILRPMDNVEKMAAYMERLHKSGEAEMMETEAMHREGRRISVELRTAPIFEGEEYLGLAAVVYDMQERKALEKELRRLAGTDPLTGVANRLGYETAADHEVKRAIRYKHPLSLFITDIDFFKKVNDTYGHAGGDVTLKRFAEVIASTLRRPVDHIARTGGEEFVAILPETDANGAIAAAERVRASTEELLVEHGDQQIRITASFGVSRWDPGEETLEAALERADQALYRAKENGRNAVIYQAPPAPEEVSLVG